MSELIARRAVSTVQKEAKRDAILIAARALFVETGFSDINIAEIARRAGLAKGTVYLYFKTKEEIFLNLASEELESWFDVLDNALLSPETTRSIPDFVGMMKGLLAERPLLLRLIPPLHLVFENNISLDQALRIKQALARRIQYTGGLIEKGLGFLAEGQGLEVLLNIQCFIVGFGQMAAPSPILREILERPEMAAFRIDLLESFERSLGIYLTGLKAMSAAQE
ncbi:TetR family transcriptional regulator [Sneathiella sp.]|uniref:TetR family transcriptional regulator n=1 Tax=Sneathiella sp. TaxID=1964365 RepID=UPI00261280BC|nr:TetR family transcriptional regulator [Sneathiella sp.]MDF2368989.1 TetR family transcriptional regulator [Sneathiella sp.]